MTTQAYEVITFAVPEIEELFYALCMGYHHGVYNLEVVKSGLDTLAYFDKKGVIWTIGVNTGQWYRLEDHKWVRDSPESPLYKAYEIESGESPRVIIDLKNPIMKKLLQKI